MHYARRAESNQAALALMTAWVASPDGPPSLLCDTLERHVEGHPSGDKLNGAAEIIMGLTHLCGFLLVLREVESGITGRQTLQEVALHFSQVESDMGSSEENRNAS